MNELTDILIKATVGIGAEYFRLPLHGGEPVYRERVYCYELYHQMRLLWPVDSRYRLNGEIDKAAHPYFQNASAPKPDLLVHQPGTGDNYAVIEVKTSQAVTNGIAKDIETLTRFTHQFGYERGVYLFYGAVTNSTIRIAERVAVETPNSEKIEIWIHNEVGIPAVRIR